MLQLQALKDRFAMDAKKLRQQSVKELQEQEKRLHNMSEANRQQLEAQRNHGGGSGGGKSVRTIIYSKSLVPLLIQDVLLRVPK